MSISYRWAEETVDAFRQSVRSVGVEVFQMETAIFRCYLLGWRTHILRCSWFCICADHGLVSAWMVAYSHATTKLSEILMVWIFGGFEFSPEVTDGPALMRGLSDMSEEMHALGQLDWNPTLRLRFAHWMKWKQARYGRVWRMLKAA